MMETEPLLSSKSPDFFNKSDHFSSQNTGVTDPPMIQFVSLILLLCDFDEPKLTF